MGNLISNGSYNNKWARKTAPITDAIGRWGSKIVLSAINPAVGALHSAWTEGVHAAIGDDDYTKTRQELAKANINSDNPFERAAAGSSRNIESEMKG